MAKERILMYASKQWSTNAYEYQIEKDESPFEIVPTSDLLSENTVNQAKGFNIVSIFVNDKLNAKTAETLAQLGVGLVVLRCAGFDGVDVAACTKHGITVTRVPAYSPHAVAEFAVGLLLGVNRKIHRASSKMLHGDFSLDGLVGWDLYGKTAGVIGTGATGAIVATILRAFGMRVLCSDIYKNPSLLDTPGITYVDTLDELLPECDVISLHCPLTEHTKRMVNREFIAKCKRGFTLLNVARGGLVDSEALLQGLRQGQVGAAGMDVYENETEIFFHDHREAGIHDDNLGRLLLLPQVLITPHQAFLTRDALNTIVETSLESIRQYLSGQRLHEVQHSLNKPPVTD
ncbi:D-isomer-specific 2-hydroxyacid dehydrogenase NAD-binding protein [Dacryopinax primogenitus]|uniref:D-isomer-specific 2-hydroxyacid dehydrogenase NAD-binding protein n=1 Tax=Dacryopinax primogenitus (strain DJM 731) TaxID=1858805 RepID=M5G6K8_DACPD|nr:D-isomer-specific 2-hydroxyacid dehydrogenase NAD-binding protein [Dacryopinax primogenitus]EJU01457.1 D-isomer-specific 2-hydroxyacid dehydrogenase NAD-binding protein [Dacryopinax primogenitus]